MIETFVENGKVWTYLKNLKNYQNNYREIKDTGFARVKKQRKELVQFKPYLINAEGTIIDGNQSSMADLQNYGPETKVWVEVLEIVYDQVTQLYYVKQDGVIRTDKKGFNSVEDAMQTYNMVANDHGGSPDMEKIANNLPQLTLDGDLIALQIGKPIHLKKLQDNPNFVKDLKKRYGVLIEAPTEEEQEQIFTKLSATGLKVTKRSL